MKTLRLFFFSILSFPLLITAQTFDAGFNPNFTNANNDVLDVIELEDSSIIVGGHFSYVNGARANNIAQLDKRGRQIFNFNAGEGFNRTVRQLEWTHDGKIIAAGEFWRYNGQPVRRIVRLLADGKIDTTFHIGSGFDNQVNGFAQLANGDLIVVGEFNNYNGFPAKRLAKIKPNGSLDTTFNKEGSGVTYSSPYSILKLSGDTILLGLSSTAVYNGLTRTIVKIDAEGVLDTSFQFLTTDRIYAVRKMLRRMNGTIALWLFGRDDKFVVISEDGEILDEVTDNFETPGTIRGITEESEQGTILINAYDSWEKANVVYYYTESGDVGRGSILGIGKNVRALKLLKNNVLLASGRFNFWPTSFLAKQHFRSSYRDAFAAQIETTARIFSLALQEDGKILVDGTFSRINNRSRPVSGLSRLMPDGQLDEDFKPVYPGNHVNLAAIAIQEDGKILIANDLSLGDGFYRLNPGGDLDDTFKFDPASVSNLGRVVSDLIVLEDGRIGLTGSGLKPRNTTFSSNNIFWLNPDGSINEAMHSFFAAEEFGYGIELTNGQLLLGGRDLSFKESEPASLIRIHNNELDLNFANIELSSDMQALQESIYIMDIEADGSILVGGRFNRLNGISISSGMACLNPDGTLKEDSGIVEGFLRSDQNYSYGWVTELKVLKDGYILVSGVFNSYNNIPVSGIILLDPNKQLIKSFPFYNLLSIDAIAADGSWGYLAGEFLTEADNQGSSLTRFNLETVPTRQMDSQTLDLFNIYPTVVQNELTIAVHQRFQDQNFDVHLFDLQGRKIKSWKGLRYEDRLQLPAGLTDGTYFVQLQIGKYQQTRRVIKVNK